MSDASFLVLKLPQSIISSVPSPKKIFQSSLQDDSSSLLEKVCKVAKMILLTGISLFLYWTNPTLVAVGFIAGMIFEEGIQEAIDKIKLVWSTQTWKSCVVGGIAAFFSLPVTLAASSVFCGAVIGNHMAKESKKYAPQYQEIIIKSEDEKLEMPPEDACG